MRAVLMVASAAALSVGGAIWMTLGGSEPALAQSGEQGAPIVEIVLPDSLTPKQEMGKRAFDAVCADCHGQNATGLVGKAPPLVHKIYEPSHHGDMAFLMAVQRGVRAHHWRFGDMPPQSGLTPSDVANIVDYVRALQRENGID
jgi:mono/diheme cytochrome c family protein